MPIHRTFFGKTVKLMVLAIICLGNNRLYLLPPHPLFSSLFPYTTLFRSSALAMAAALEELGLRPRPASLIARPNVNTDRKSTRLNSSHVAISYAVFCMKKKMIVLALICLRNNRQD